MKWILSAVSFVALIGLLSCDGGPTCPPGGCYVDPCIEDSTTCNCNPDQDSCSVSEGVAHRAEKVSNDVLPSIDGMTVAVTTKDVQDFLGAQQFKIAFTFKREIYLLLPSSDSALPPEIVTLTKGNENYDGTRGVPNEPLFSPDGRYVAYGGHIGSLVTTKISWVHVAEKGLVWRVPIDTNINSITASPHWYKSGDSLFVIYLDKFGANGWISDSAKYSGDTYMAQVLSDSVVGPSKPAVIRGADIPGAFKGGVSGDGKYVGSTYATTVMFSTESKTSTVLNGREQQCNASMNPFPNGSTNTDYMMILGFGGDVLVPAIGGGIKEGQHQNLWIWDIQDQAVWRAEMPQGYKGEWQKPEWSTHKNFATALASATDGGSYDLFIVKISNDENALINNDESALLNKAGDLNIISGNFSGSDWQHLWVGN